MNNPTIYDMKAEGDSLKLKPKAVFSPDLTGRKLRVGPYVRVSTDKDEQAESYETQMKHYRKLLAEHEDWVLVDIYSDEKSGTSTRRRDGFNRMNADVEAGKLDLIITKSVSRFARNLVDGIQTSRKFLKRTPPVGIFFEEENFNTLRPDSEFMLSVMLLMAQGESERKSSAVKKAFQWRCDEKRYLTPTESLLGYKKDENKKLIIEPEGAKTVKAIFAMYLHGLTATRIAFLLTRSGKITGRNRNTWSASSVTGILLNEKYCGDVVAQKSTVTDTLEHKSEKNTGQAVLHYKDNHHTPIISREEYVRALYLLRANSSSAYYNPHYRIEMVREGLLAGFIPLNLAFGGYDAEHYLGAELSCKNPPCNYALDILSAPDYRLIRSQEIEHRLAAQMTISLGSITLNTDCISRLPNAKYVELLLHPTERLLAIRPATRKNKNSVPWNGKHLSASALCPILYALMGWNEMWKYKFMADCFMRGEERMLMFNLSEPEFQFVEEITENDEIKARIRRLLQPGEWQDEIGADYLSRIVASRRAFALSLDDWKLGAPAKTVDGFDGNPVKRTERELKTYLAELGVEYV
jgi:DNA invertase Pin-like site-specific DNA recombinase